MSNNYFEEQWNEIEEWFDWHKVHMTMKLLNWKWHGFGSPGVPDIEIMKQVAYNLLKKAYDNCKGLEYSYNSIATGGFKATCRGSDKRLTLEFIVSNWTYQG